MHNLEQVNQLLNKKIPSYRQAYSDRTAWIMACLSELSYIQFNSLFSTNKQKEAFIGNITRLVSSVVSKNKKNSLLSQFTTKKDWSKLIDTVTCVPEQETEKLNSHLTNLQLKLLEVFDVDGTQAILVKSNNNFIALAFRGTETTSLTDIKTDIKANLIHSEDGGKVHQGFKEAFEATFSKIQEAVNREEVSKLPLFITGHSLGGALAIITAKRIKREGGIAACYTFGSPRISNAEWFDNLKAPVYRIVNSADMVPSLPSSWIAIITGWILSWVHSSIGKFITDNFGKYRHGGDTKYLTNCPVGNFKNVELRTNVGFWRFYIRGTFSRWCNKLLSDHKISVYRKKLMVIAIRKNN